MTPCRRQGVQLGMRTCGLGGLQGLQVVVVAVCDCRRGWPAGGACRR